MSRHRASHLVDGRQQREALNGNYTAVNVETIDKSDPSVPCLYGACGLNYQSIWVKL